MNIRWLSSMFDLSTITSELTSAHIKLWFALLSSSIALNCAGWIILPAPNTLLIGVLTTSDHTWYLSHSKSIRQSTTVHGRSMCPLTTQYNANVKYCHKWWRQKQPLIFKVSGIKYIYLLFMFAETHTSISGNCLRPQLNVDPESVGAIHGMSGTGSYLPCPAWCLMSHSDTDRSRRVEAGMVGRVQLSGRVSVTTSHGPASEGAGACRESECDQQSAVANIPVMWNSFQSSPHFYILTSSDIPCLTVLTTETFHKIFGAGFKSG